MKRLLIMTMILVFVSAMLQGYAATITGTAPYLTISGFNLTNLNNEIESQFNTAIAQANVDLAPYQDQEKLAIGFANANAYSTNTATQQGYPKL